MHPSGTEGMVALGHGVARIKTFYLYHMAAGFS